MSERAFIFNCEYCGSLARKRPSHYARYKRNFCSRKCYAGYRRDILPKEEQHRYGTGADESTRKLKRKARSDLNHAIRDGIIKRQPCMVCGDQNSEGHHQDYSKPLEVKWLCFKHHRMVHEHPHLAEGHRSTESAQAQPEADHEKV